MAHALLADLDDEFKAEGNDGRYSRWMDDVVVGAGTYNEALAIVGRVQTVLEKMSLYPNLSKTRIYRSMEFRSEYMKDLNDYLGMVHEQTETGQQVDRATFRSELRAHLGSGGGRPKAWGRVLRRFYTESRRLEEPALLRHWSRHLVLEPTSAAQILDYLSVFRITTERVGELRVALEETTELYSDVRILAMEYLAQAPNVNSLACRAEICQLARDVLQEALERDPCVAASAVVVIGKHGQAADLEALRILFDAELRLDSPVRQQALLVLLGASLLGEGAIDAAAPHSTFDSSVHLRYLRSLIDSEPGAVNRALGLLEPAERRYPARWTMRPRSLFLAPLVRSVDPARYERILSSRLARLQSNPARMRDLAAERWIQTTGAD